MRTSAETKAVNDGYSYSGAYYKTGESNRCKARILKFRSEGYKARKVNCDGGAVIWLKDTPKTLEAKAAKEAIKEQERLEQVEALKVLFASRVDSLTSSEIYSLTRDMTPVVWSHNESK
tara:strand:+ start:2329 stop:2685 length:357 start_codon:yes stop_codon:yes gene_type:complete